MIYLLISNIVLAICLCMNLIVSHIERKKLTEMLASKDYAQYKQYEKNETNEKEHTNMYKKRTEKQTAYILEGE